MDNELTGGAVDTSPVEATASEPVTSSEPSYDTPEPSVEASEPVSEGDSVVASASNGEASFELYDDPVTGKREFRVKPVEEVADEATEPVIEEPADNGNSFIDDMSSTANDYVNPKPQGNYDLDEFSQAIATGNVDPDRVPEEYRAQYESFRIDQAKAEYNRNLQAEEMRRQQVAQQLEQQQMTPEQRVQVNQQFYDGLQAEASRRAMIDLGINQDTLDNADFEEGGEQTVARYQNAVNYHKQQLMSQMQARYNSERAYQAQQQQLYAEIQQFTKEVQAKDPANFNAIDRLMATRYETLPYKEAETIKQAITALSNGTLTRQQAEVIKKYHADTRKEYYARKNGLDPNRPKQVKRPPSVERAGDGSGRSAKAPDYAALRNADARGKKAWLADFMKNITL